MSANDSVDEADVGWRRIQVPPAHRRRGDGDRDLSTPLTRYYNADGTPPGRWMGSGIAALGGGHLDVGDEVSGLFIIGAVGCF